MMCVLPIARFQRQNRGFTLIELLVVISIIALLISILLPALRHARDAARMSLCLSNTRQIATSALAYEVDNGRMPAHYIELRAATGSAVFGSAEQMARDGDARHDVRPLWMPYIGNINFFQCPLLPFNWDMGSVAIPSGTTRIYGSYAIFAGYVREDMYTPGKDKVWTNSAFDWTFNDGNMEYRFNVIAGDNCWDLSGTYRMNHPVDGMAAISKTEPGSWAGVYYQAVLNYDPRNKTPQNFSFTDGSASSTRGDDNRWVFIPMLGRPDERQPAPHK